MSRGALRVKMRYCQGVHTANYTRDGTRETTTGLQHASLRGVVFGCWATCQHSFFVPSSNASSPPPTPFPRAADVSFYLAPVDR